MRKICFMILGLTVLAGTAAAEAMEGGMDMGDGGHGGHMQCGDPAQPLLSVADFDGQGDVNGLDIALLARNLGKKGSYYAIYDRNGDRELTRADLDLARQDMGKTSTSLDRELAKMYHRFRDLQLLQGADAFAQRAYVSIPVALKGHGAHWFNQEGFASMLGKKAPNVLIAEGLNIDTVEERVHGVFWAYPAVPVFDNGATDYPNGEEWKDGHVVAFANEPVKLTSSHDENWHAHGGLCMTVEHIGVDDNGQPIRFGHANQYVSFNECQALPNDEPQADGSNMWAAFWMLHVWLFDPNPNGLFAGTHPCVEPHGLDEATINGDREVPPFFANMH